MRFLTRLADSRNNNSLASRYRLRRIELLRKMILSIHAKPLRLLDLGGTTEFWKDEEFTSPSAYHITIVNIERMNSQTENVTCITSDAGDLSQLYGQKYDLIFSNSLIEHLGTPEHQLQMANEILKFNTSYFIQTPAYIFPLEQHFLMPFFHWLPIPLRVWMHRHFHMGWFHPEHDRKKAGADIRAIRIMKKKELRKLFINANISTEFFLLIPKSYIVTHLKM